DGLELDPLHVAVAAELDHRHVAVPWVVEEDGALAAHGLELVAAGHRRATVEQGDHIAREAQHPAENPVGAGGAEPRLAVYLFRLAPEEARAADGVAPDVHQGAALDVRAQPDVVLVVERIAERRANETQLADRAAGDELLYPLRLRVVAIHERLA